MFAADEAPHEAQDAGGDQPEAHGVEPHCRAAALAHPQQGNRHQHDAERYVEPEDPVPVEALGDGPAHQRAAGHGQAGQGEEDAERGAAAFGREGGADERERQRRDHGGRGALHGARRDEGLGRGRERAGRRGGREQRHARGERPAPAHAVADHRGRHEQDGEGQVEGVEDPLELLEGRVEIVADGAEGRCHDERVEGGHEAGRRGDGEHPGASAGNGVRHGIGSFSRWRWDPGGGPDPSAGVSRGASPPRSRGRPARGRGRRPPRPRARRRRGSPPRRRGATSRPRRPAGGR